MSSNHQGQGEERTGALETNLKSKNIVAWTTWMNATLDNSMKEFSDDTESLEERRQ